MDEAFATPEQALESLGQMATAEASKLVFEHAQSRWDRAESTRDATRDKAKVILGATTVAFAIATAVAAQVLAIPSKLSWAHILLLAGLILVVAHFIRALALSLEAITRDVLEYPSTQRWAQILSSEQLTDGKAYLSMAAETLASAIATSARLRERVNRVILAQTSFKWALILSPFLLIASAAVAGDQGQRKDRENSTKLEALEKQDRIMSAQMSDISDRLKSLDDHLRTLRSLPAQVDHRAPQVIETGVEASRGPRGSAHGGRHPRKP